MPVDVDKEAKTLKEWFGEATRGDGRKFMREGWNPEGYFEPIFYSPLHRLWHGLGVEGQSLAYDEGLPVEWLEWTPPTKSKKVRLYKPVYKDSESSLYYMNSIWQSDKDRFSKAYKIVGWVEKEVEVADEG